MNQTDKFLATILNSYDVTGIINPADGIHYPSRRQLMHVLELIQEILFPGFFGVDILNEQELPEVTQTRLDSLFELLNLEIEKCLSWNPESPDVSGNHPADVENKPVAEHIVTLFLEEVPSLRKQLRDDAIAMYDGDPAAKSLVEVVLSYPGFLAVMGYRIAHFFYSHNVPLIPRMFTEIVHAQTGIDIHPGAQIGASFCIDHGSGIVIGETAVIGNHVKLYQGVTLGAFSVKKGMDKGQRHPTLHDNVTVYAMSTILGGNTVVGENAIVGGNIWLTKSIPANSKIYLSEDVESTYRLIEGEKR